ncbi:SDR family NAD(P)-dependent oxidoreductase [Herbidospora galbida]|uniref:SDR family NAD(P)-dependent oxidoreductase n=1 Tax=Herbidospora galbida TaxID=2575442 RepID=UPI002482B99E|nr:SDR family NAD(P)-dependent oxidoreductase [Herbidospora galbida]
MKPGEQVVVVTGASGGVGRAVAEAFGARRAKVALLARGVKGLGAAAGEVRRAAAPRWRSRSTCRTSRRWTPPPAGPRPSSARSTCG